MAEAKTLHITQVRSQIGRPADQGKTLKALGLGKIGRSGLFVYMFRNCFTCRR